jgi:DinB superfamily
MSLQLSEAVAVLERTPRTLRALLEGLPEAWLGATEGASTWSAFDVVGHLCDGEETDWIPRARIILEHGEARPFDPYDRFRHQRVDHGRTLEERLARFDRLRSESLRSLAALSIDEAALARRGTHPELGPVTLGQLLATWVAHDLDHLHQISRVLARRYRDDVGPWVAYLRVVRD